MVNKGTYEEIGVFKVTLLHDGIKVEFDDVIEPYVDDNTMTRDEQIALLSITHSIIERVSLAMAKSTLENIRNRDNTN